MTRTIATESRSTSSSPKPDRRDFMRLIKCPWACVALALASPAMAQQSASLPPGANARNEVESGIPLTPGMIRDLGRRVGDNKRAEGEVNTGGLADQPAGQCLVCPRPSDVDHSDR